MSAIEQISDDNNKMPNGAIYECDILTIDTCLLVDFSRGSYSTLVFRDNRNKSW